jgi:hypothetical protein
LLGSLVESTHEPAQEICPPRQLQAPLTHCSAGSQTLAQAPQFWGSLDPSIQLWPQVNSGEVHLALQAPPEQT